MRTYEEVRDSARNERPFSNGTEGYGWMGAWCCRCVNDVNEDCPLIAVAMCDQQTPIEWFDQKKDGELFSIVDQYHCVEFRDIDGGGGDPKPAPEPIPGQGELIPAEPYVGARMFADVVAEASRSVVVL